MCVCVHACIIKDTHPTAISMNGHTPADAQHTHTHSQHRRALQHGAVSRPVFVHVCKHEFHTQLQAHAQTCLQAHVHADDVWCHVELSANPMTKQGRVHAKPAILRCGEGKSRKSSVHQSTSTRTSHSQNTVKFPVRAAWATDHIREFDLGFDCD